MYVFVQNKKNVNNYFVENSILSEVMYILFKAFVAFVSTIKCSHPVN